MGEDEKVKLSEKKYISPEVKSACLVYDTQRIILLLDNQSAHSTVFDKSAGDGFPALVELFHQLDDVADHLRITLDVGFGKVLGHE